MQVVALILGKQSRGIAETQHSVKMATIERSLK